GWSQMKKLNGNVNQHLVDHAFISPSGKKLFFIWYYGGYRMFYSDWDSTKNDWGVAKDCGPNINYTEDGAISGGTMPDDTTLLFLGSNLTYISHWDKTAQSWTKAHRFPGYPDDYEYFASDWSSLHATPGLKKIYLMGGRPDKDKDGHYYVNCDIVVCYKTSQEHDIYNGPYLLHFCLDADTLYWNGNYTDRFEGNPVLTPDGKTMYFFAHYNGIGNIYETHMIVDENGDSVLTDVKEKKNALIPNEIKLFPLYPNPFNPETVITYQLPNETDLEISINDLLGRRIDVLYSGKQTTGRHELQVNIDKYNLSSGVYLILLKTHSESLLQKALVIK
ncbi:MAG: T9SS type A sorting domain-containing protein, partial [Bacteroidota bacterium]|nr:T9SS type A sorting domain-containing protein [Bacteroidota bacterium]